ncbi:hypothetical protein AB0F42_24355 [Streptomyces buecherae]|uniref:hypothetical protein n=1 Tax=Streptomyces buecherae TaxID=2763006 RepID=UPI003400BA69
MSDTPRRFHLQRDHDLTGVSGTGRIADGVRWPDGTVALRWRTTHASTAIWASTEELIAVHGHGGDTRIIWDDPEPTTAPDPLTVLHEVETAPRGEPVPGCPHCPDGHTPPDHGQPWAAWVGPERDGDGQPMTIHVARAAGAHVAESDAEWVRARLNGAPDDH